MATFQPGDEPDRCCAKVKRSDPPRRCKKKAVLGRAVCKKHGGHAGAPCKSGRYSKSLGAKIAASFHESKNDPGILDPVEPLALLDVKVKRSMERVEELDTPGFRKHAREIMREYREANADGDEMTADGKLDALEDLITQGVEEDAAFNVLINSVKDFAKQQRSALDVHLAAANSINRKDFISAIAEYNAIVEKVCPPKYARLVLLEVEGRYMAAASTKAIDI